MEDKETNDSQTVRKELNLLSYVSIHFDKEEVKFLYFNLNCNYMKVNELLANIPNEKIKAKIEALETKTITKDQFSKAMNGLIEEKFKEDEKLKQKVKIEMKYEEWNIPKSTSPLLGNVPLSDILLICQYLDIYSLNCLSRTEKYMYKQEKNSSIYKMLSSIVHRPLQQAHESLYAGLCTEVSRPNWGRLPEITRATIVSDIRGYVWGKDPATIKTGKKYFKDVVHYRDLFFKFPRLLFNGYYSCCETYFRKGEADITGYYVPIHYVKSYRNLRFFDNGLVLYLITTKELKPETAVKRLSMDALYAKQEREDRQTPLYLGEYILANDCVLIKMPDRSWMNEMEHKLKLDTDGLSYLHINSHQMRELDTNCKQQMERDMAEKERKYYFERVPEFLNDVKCKQLKAVYDYTRSTTDK